MTIEDKLLNNDTCYGLPGECDESLGLICSGPAGSQVCALVFKFKLEPTKIILVIFFILFQ